jgi:hypothetical protein
VIGAHDGAGHGSEMASPSLTGGLPTRREMRASQREQKEGDALLIASQLGPRLVPERPRGRGELAQRLHAVKLVAQLVIRGGPVARRDRRSPSPKATGEGMSATRPLPLRGVDDAPAMLVLELV